VSVRRENILEELNTHSPGCERLLLLHLLRERKLGILADGLPYALAVWSRIAKEVRSLWPMLRLAMNDRTERLHFAVGG
jgi:hypothetical protein